MALAPPRLPSAKPKNFQTLNRHPKSWTFIQFFDWTFSQCSVAWGEWVLTQVFGRMDADHRSVNECSFMDPGLTIGHFLNTIQTLDIFCRSRRQFCRAVTYWFYWGFLNLSFSLDIFCLCNFYAKISQKIFCPKSSIISICYRFFILARILAQAMQYTQTNMTKTIRLRMGRLATGNMPSAWTMRQALT